MQQRLVLARELVRELELELALALAVSVVVAPDLVVVTWCCYSA